MVEKGENVDVLICCRGYTILAHKFILSANSPLFQKKLELCPNIEQIIFNGLCASVTKALIDFMYGGRAEIDTEYFQLFLVAGKQYQIEGLVAAAKVTEFSPTNIFVPPPSFMITKPAYKPHRNLYPKFRKSHHITLEQLREALSSTAKADTTNLDLSQVKTFEYNIKDITQLVRIDVKTSDNRSFRLSYDMLINFARNPQQFELYDEHDVKLRVTQVSFEQIVEVLSEQILTPIKEDLSECNFDEKTLCPEVEIITHVEEPKAGPSKPATFNASEGTLYHQLLKAALEEGCLSDSDADDESVPNTPSCRPIKSQNGKNKSKKMKKN